MIETHMIETGIARHLLDDSIIELRFASPQVRFLAQAHRGFKRLGAVESAPRLEFCRAADPFAVPPESRGPEPLME